MKGKSPILALAFSLATGTSASAQPRTVTEFTKITPSDGYPVGFGASIAVSGDNLVVGAPGYITKDGVVGTAYVFHRVGPRWVETGKLFTPFMAIDGEGFGWSVAIEGDNIVVGAPQFVSAPEVGGGYGRVFIFRRDDRGTPDDPLDDQWWRWSELRTPDEIRWGDNYGASVAISDGLVLIGKSGAEFILGARSGAYLYRNLNGQWRHVGSLYPSDSHIGDQFGAAVSLSGPVALVGAPHHLEAGLQTGAAYVYRETGGDWLQEEKLTAITDPPRGGFGTAVSVAGEQAAIGTGGRAYVCAKIGDAWDSRTQLFASDPDDLGGFGRAVATNGSEVVVGAPGENSHMGAAYVFELDSELWLQKRKLVASNRPGTEVLGASVAVNKAYAFAGAREAVFVYVLPSAAKSLRDYSSFQSCFRGEERELDTKCAEFDLVGDGQIDIRDFNELLARLAGP